MVKQNSHFKNKKTTDALFAIAAGILTNILWGFLSNGHFEGTFVNGYFAIYTIDQYGFWVKCGILICIYFITWIVLGYGIPIISYIIDSRKQVKKPTIKTEDIEENYKKCKQDLIALEERAARSETSDVSNCMLFVDICKCIILLEKYFCSETNREKALHIKAAFRTSVVPGDIEKKVSSYEYLAVVRSLQRMLDCVYSTIEQNDNKLLRQDYQEMQAKISNLLKVMDNLNINYKI